MKLCSRHGVVTVWTTVGSMTSRLRNWAGAPTAAGPAQAPGPGLGHVPRAGDEPVWLWQDVSAGHPLLNLGPIVGSVAHGVPRLTAEADVRPARREVPGRQSRRHSGFRLRGLHGPGDSVDLGLPCRHLRVV